MFMAINFRRVGKYNSEFSSIKSPYSLIPWSCKVRLNILAAVSLLPHGLWPLNPLSHTTL